MRAPWMDLLLFCLFLILNCYSTTAQTPVDYPIANLSTILFCCWMAQGSEPSSLEDHSDPDSPVVSIAMTPAPLTISLSFMSKAIVVLVVPLNQVTGTLKWCGQQTGTIQLAMDVDGSIVWNTNTTGKSVAGLNLTDDGNLVLFDVNSSVVWQSFDYPTDCLVLGQRLLQGQQLIPSVSSTNWTAQKDLFSLQVKDDGFFAYVGSNPPLAYYVRLVSINDAYTGRRYARFLNGSLSFFISSVDPSDPDGVIPIPRASSAQYMKLMSDGHLKVFEWRKYWLVVADPFSDYIEECDYPMACGRNGICSGNQQCSCPVSRSAGIPYFRAVNDRQPNLGCSEITPLICNAIHDQTFIELEKVRYFDFVADMKSVDSETCKQACLNNCTCKAALFQYDSESSSGDCFLPFELFTLINADQEINRKTTIAFIKVQNVRSPPSASKSRSNLGVILTFTIGSVLFLIGVIGFLINITRKRRRDTQMEEECIGEVPGLPNRFSYEELKTTTGNFNKKLGEGGFGAVFKGTLEDGSTIAVKCLEGLGQVNKSFLAEVQSIGSIHHVNLVTLRGFGAWKAQRFLVYEFMSNGSLDRWIYHGDREQVLEWKCRKKIILDVAKGLAYLHEECRQKIIHLDSDFNAKVSDFGLSKLIDRNQSQVMTTMRGTPGYLAPEWLSSVITEKVDVYSFGIVLLEMLCGRKKYDRSQPEESWNLLDVLQKSWEQGTLQDMVDKYSEDIKTHSSEVVDMIKVASWCLQYDYTKRPSMSTVVKVLEGVMKVESRLDYNFTDPRLQNAAVEEEKDMTQLMASVLSGPR
ncbi:putative protein kinase RLK-Pelle-SD-2b family [Helianthus annuus]|nr:putative protein kinase RLK-Pelle-SD-2b family [Helianthus annuus]